MSVITKDLGAVSAYGLALEAGFEGTEQEYAELLASYGTVAEEAGESAAQAAQAVNAAGQILGQTSLARDAAISAKEEAVVAKDLATQAANVAGRYGAQAQAAKTGAESAQAAAESAKDSAVDIVDGFNAEAQQALDSVNEAGANWKSLAEKQAGNSEAWAVGQRGGVDVPTTDATYHNNAKYYASQLDTAVETATGAAQTATIKASDASASASAAAESARTLTIDVTLTQSGQAADAKVVGDEIAGLKEDLSDRFQKMEPINWFDKQTAILGKHFDYYGNLATLTTCFAAYIPVTTGKYVFRGTKIDLGGNVTRITYFDAEKNRLGAFVATTDDSGNYPLLTLNVTDAAAKYIGITYRINGVSAWPDGIDTYMVVKGETYPETYYPYFAPYIKLTDTFVPENLVSGLPQKYSEVDRVTEKVNGIYTTYLNIFDIDAEHVAGYLENGTIIGSSGSTFDYIPVTEYGTYISNAIPKLLYAAQYNNSIAFYDAEKTYLRNADITITVDDNNNSVGTFTIDSDVKFIRVTLAGTGFTNGTAMIIYGNELPNVYVENGETNLAKADFIDVIKGNVLYGKTAVFDGDSICDDYTDKSNNGSYAGRISVANGLSIFNYGVGGGTITSETYAGSTPRHWVVENIDTVYTDHPDADYIILEGGTNDADVIGRIVDGTTPERFGSFNLTDYSGTYDSTTFCGAVETLLFKAINYWPGKKIGFVIAMKMGKTSAGYTAATNNRRAYFQTIMDICTKWGVPYLNLWDECHMNPSLNVCYDSSMTSDENIAAGKMYIDGQHPAPNGYDYIAPIIGEWMKTL